MPPASTWRRSCACAAKPSTFSDSTGNTQGIRFSSAPPSSASSSAAHRPSAATAGAGGSTSALPSAGSGATAATAGQGVVTCSASCRPAGASGVVSTTGMRWGPSLRCGSSGSVADQVSPFHAATGLAAFCSTPGVSGSSVNGLPCHAAGRPATRTTRSPPCTAAEACAPGTGCGSAARAASKSPAFAAVAACTGSCSANSPDSGMQTSLHTSQSARSFTSSVCAAKPAGTVTGTGSSSVPS